MRISGCTMVGVVIKGADSAIYGKDVRICILHGAIYILHSGARAHYM